jgi:Domain of unknown function (DUF4272)
MPVTLIACATVMEVPEFRFRHRLETALDRGDPGFPKQISYLSGYVHSRGGANWHGVKSELWRHLQRTKRISAVTIEETERSAFGDWARAANAISIGTGGEGVCDPAGRVLLGHQGEEDPAAELPYPPEAQARKARTEARLRAEGVRLFEGQAPVVGESEVEPRAAADAALRAMALYVTAHCAKLIDTGWRVGAATFERRWPLACGGFSPKEAAFVAGQGEGGRRPSAVAIDIEAARALFWAVSAASLPEPQEEIDSADLNRLMADISEREFIAGARLRPSGEILDALDLFSRLRWSILRRMDALDDSLPEYPVATAIQERYVALRWLVRNSGDEPWDESFS